MINYRHKGLVLVGIIVLICNSCASMSDKYLESNIIVCTNNQSVAGMTYVNGDVTEAGSAYGARDVGIMIANQLADQGLNNLYVLVELVSRGDANAPNIDIGAHLNMWKYSIYRAQN